jgi:predicted kinase
MELIIFSGIQCAGKSTFYQNRFATSHFRINLDTLKTRKKEMDAFSLLIEEMSPVVIDNTNPDEISRAKYIDMAKMHGYRVIGFQFDVPLPIALERSSKRSGQRMVPDFVIKNTIEKMRPLSLSEGFDEIFIVDPTGEILSIAQTNQS